MKSFEGRRFRQSRRQRPRFADPYLASSLCRVRLAARNSVERLTDLSLGAAQLIELLQIHPELGARIEITTEAQRGVGGDRPCAVENAGHPVGRDTDGARVPCRSDAERLNRLGQMLSRMNRTP